MTVVLIDLLWCFSPKLFLWFVPFLPMTPCLGLHSIHINFLTLFLFTISSSIPSSWSLGFLNNPIKIKFYYLDQSVPTYCKHAAPGSCAQVQPLHCSSSITSHHHHPGKATGGSPGLPSSLTFSSLLPASCVSPGSPILTLFQMIVLH